MDSERNPSSFKSLLRRYSKIALTGSMRTDHLLWFSSLLNGKGKTMLSRTSRKKPVVAPQISAVTDPPNVVSENSISQDPSTTLKSPDITQILDVRGAAYGNFIEQWTLAQQLKDRCRSEVEFHRLPYHKKEAIDQILQRISRIIKGDPNYADSWVDIEGYARLGVHDGGRNE